MTTTSTSNWVQPEADLSELKQENVQLVLSLRLSEEAVERWREKARILGRENCLIKARHERKYELERQLAKRRRIFVGKVRHLIKYHSFDW